MAEAPGIPGQIMHSPTVEKMIQPLEAKGDVATQNATADSDRAQQLERRSVGQVREAEGGRVEEDQTGEKREQERRRQAKKKKGLNQADGDEVIEGQGHYIDLKV